jgi:hypothetical protein
MTKAWNVARKEAMETAVCVVLFLVSAVALYVSVITGHIRFVPFLLIAFSLASLMGGRKFLRGRRPAALLKKDPAPD